MKAKIHTIEHYEQNAKIACLYAERVMCNHVENINLQNMVIKMANSAIKRLDAARGKYVN